jgi:hypothetical protein
MGVWIVVAARPELGRYYKVTGRSDRDDVMN